MKTIHERIKHAREKAGLTQLELAAKLGISPQAVQQWEKLDDGTTPRGARLETLSQTLGVSKSWIQFGDDASSNVAPANPRPIQSWESEDELDPEVYVFIPELAVKLSAGCGNMIWHVDEAGQRQAFRRKWAERLKINPEHAATMVVDGSSMEPRLLDGDSVVVDYEQNQYIVDGKVYAIALNGEVFIKRLFKELNGGVRVVSDNPDKVRYPDRLIPQNSIDLLKLIGKVVAVSGGVM